MGVRKHDRRMAVIEARDKSDGFDDDETATFCSYEFTRMCHHAKELKEKLAFLLF